MAGGGRETEPGLPELERQLISRTLERVAGQRRQAAEILGISLDELNLKIRSYGLGERVNPAMFFPPLIFLLMVAFFLTALVMLPLLMVGLSARPSCAGDFPRPDVLAPHSDPGGQPGQHPHLQVENRAVVGEQVVSYFGMRFRVPGWSSPVDHSGGKCGGALIPMALSAIYFQRKFWRQPADPVGGGDRGGEPPGPPGARHGHRGAGSGASPGGGPGSLSPVSAGASGSLRLYRQHHGHLDRGRSAESGAIRQLGAPVASIGGAGTFDAIFLSGIIAVPLS